MYMYECAIQQVYLRHATVYHWAAGRRDPFFMWWRRLALATLDQRTAVHQKQPQPHLPPVMSHPTAPAPLQARQLVTTGPDSDLTCPHTPAGYGFDRQLVSTGLPKDTSPFRMP